MILEIKYRRSGAVALISVLVISAVIVVIGVGINLRSIGSLQSAFKSRRSTEAFYVADTCIEEALIRLRRNAAYSGGSLAVGDGTCTITIAVNGNERTVTATATVDTFTRVLEAVVDVVNKIVTMKKWREVP